MKGNTKFAANITRLEQISDELFEIANSMAGDKTGIIAVNLHQATGKINNAIRMANEGITKTDSDKVADEWCDNLKMPVSPEQRKLIKSLLP